MKTSYFLSKNNLKSFFRPGWKGMGDPGVEKLFKLFLVKEQLVFMKKRAYLIYFVSASEHI